MASIQDEQAKLAGDQPASKLWVEKPSMGDGLERADLSGSALSGVTFSELYIFLWKLALASAAFALPFAAVYLILMNAK